MKKQKHRRRQPLDGAKWYEALLFGVLAGAIPTVLFLLAL